MCFRPPSAVKPVKCPSCGTMNPSTSTVCRKCKEKLQTTDNDKAKDKE